MEETLYLLTRLSFFFDFLKRFEGVTDVVSLPLLTGTLLFGAFSAYVVYQVYFHPLAHIPGPFLSKLTYLSFVARYHSRKESTIDLENFAKYGPIVRCGPNIVIYADPKWTPLVYGGKTDKTDMYKGFQGYFGIFSIIKHHEHAEVRKKIGGAFTNEKVKEMIPQFKKRINRWLNNIGDEYADTGKTFDLVPWISYLTIDILTQMCFGRSLDLSGTRSDPRRIHKCLEDDMVIAGTIQRWPTLRKLLFEWTPLGALQNPRVGDTRGIGNLMTLASEYLPPRLTSPTPTAPNDILSVLISARTTPSGLDEPTLLKDLVLTIAAGLDTTAGSLRNILVQTLSHPSTLPWLRSSSFSPRHLSALITESNRLHNPSQSPFPRLAPPSGLNLDGTFIPPGTDIYASGTAFGRSRALFGEDADEFRPQRWMEMTSEEWAEKERKLFTFGAGTRNCLGRGFAEAEMAAFLKGLWEEFEVELVQEVRRYWYNLMFYEGGIQVRLKRRRFGGPLEE